MKPTVFAGILCASLVLAAGDAVADSILLNNGKILDGFVLLEREGEFIFQTEQTKLNISRDQVAEHVKETPAAYHLRLGEEALVNEDYGIARQHLSQALSIQSDSERASLNVGEIQKVVDILMTGGQEAYQEYMQEQQLANDAFTLLGEGNQEAALAKLLQYYELNPDSGEVVVQLARIYLDKAKEKMFLDSATEQRMIQLAAQPVENSNIEFTTASSADRLQVMDTPEEIFAPFASINIAPLSVPTFREIHKDNVNLYNAIYYLERLSRSEASQDALIYDPSCQQWFALIQLIQQQERAYYSNLNQLSTQEAARIQEELVRQWAENRRIEIERLWSLIQEQARNSEWGYDLQDNIDALRRLNPGSDVRRQVANIGTQNNQEIDARRRLMQARSQAVSTETAAGKAVRIPRGKFGNRSTYRGELNARVTKIDPLSK